MTTRLAGLGHTEGELNVGLQRGGSVHPRFGSIVVGFEGSEIYFVCDFKQAT